MPRLYAGIVVLLTGGACDGLIRSNGRRRPAIIVTRSGTAERTEDDVWELGNPLMGDRFLSRQLTASNATSGTGVDELRGGAHSALGDGWMTGSEAGVQEAMEWQAKRREAMLSRPLANLESAAAKTPSRSWAGLGVDHPDPAEAMDVVGLDGFQLGVGGLGEVVQEVRRRVLIPLTATAVDPKLLDDLGVNPVRGLLLYGPPGCGKSMLARRLSRILSRRAPTVVSGPEVLDRFVGNTAVASLIICPPPPLLATQVWWCSIKKQPK